MFRSFTIIILLASFIGTGTRLIAQKTVTTTGNAQVRIEMDMTMQQTREMAEQQAIINAIENAFGTYTEQQTDMTIRDGMTSYNIIGTTKVKGDWIETTDLNFSEDMHIEDTKYGRKTVTYINCSIKGRVRESLPKAVLEHQILNAPNLLSRTTSFLHEEQLYVYFKSPVKGYLSIFLEDDEAAYRLLPYMNMVDSYQNGVPVKGDTDYLFFSPADNAFPGNVVDEPRLLSLKKDIEYNFIYIIFSEDEFVKPVLENTTIVEGRIIPKQLPHKKFEQWLAGNRASSEHFQVIKEKISIEQRQ